MERRQLNPLIDPVFKRIFGEEKEIIIEIINAVIPLEHPVVNIEYLPPELLPANIDDKTTIVDVRCTDVLNGHFIVEMQVAYQADLLKRILFNASRVYGRQLERGGNYDKLQPVYSLCFVDHVIDHHTNRWKHKYILINEDDPKKKIPEMELHFIELSKCRKRDDIDFTNPLDRWIKFLIDPLYVKKLTMESTFEYPNLKKAVKLLDESNYTNGQLIAYDNYLASVLSWNSTMVKQFDDGRAEGIEVGMVEGIAKGKEEGIAEGIAKGIAKGKAVEREKILGIIMDLKSGMPAAEVARKYDVEMELVDTLR